MALFIKQEVDRTELQKRIAEDLQIKARKSAELSKAPDLVDDSQYIKGTKRTTSLAWIWILIILAIVVLAIWLMITGLAR